LISPKRWECRQQQYTIGKKAQANSSYKLDAPKT
jgi:hypothetical protein